MNEHITFLTLITIFIFSPVFLSGDKTHTQNSNHAEGFLINNAENDYVDDYRELVKALEWGDILNKAKPLCILDIGCGTGRWLLALQNFVDLRHCSEIYYDCVDPSTQAVSTAMSRLQWPFIPRQSYPLTFQEVEFDCNSYDLIWSLHGLYALQGEEIYQVLSKCVGLLKPNGHAIIALASEDAFYFQCYQQFRKQFPSFSGVEQYCSAEQILSAVQSLQIPFSLRPITYNQTIPSHRTDLLEHFIMHECIGYSFNRDEDCTQGLTFDNLRSNPTMHSFIESHRKGANYVFPQKVWIIDINI